jgi:hypothetical protein
MRSLENFKFIILKDGAIALYFVLNNKADAAKNTNKGISVEPAPKYTNEQGSVFIKKNTNNTVKKFDIKLKNPFKAGF